MIYFLYIFRIIIFVVDIFMWILSHFPIKIVQNMSCCDLTYYYFKCQSQECMSFEWQSLKMYIFWVTVTQNICLLSDSHKNVCILSDSHSQCMSFEWQSLKLYIFWVTVTQNVYILSDYHSKYWQHWQKKMIWFF